MYRTNFVVDEVKDKKKFNWMILGYKFFITFGVMILLSVIFICTNHPLIGRFFYQAASSMFGSWAGLVIANRYWDWKP